MHTLIRPALFVWLLFIPLAIINGALRELIYSPYVGELVAHQISTLTASLAYLILAYHVLRKHIRNQSTWTLLGIGSFWVVLTVIFEFGFGHYVDGAPWSELVADYNLFAGHVWGLFLIGIFVTPHLVRMIAARSHRTDA